MSDYYAGRYELKYPMDIQTAGRIAAEISDRCLLDSHSAADGSYRVDSLYFDTPDLHCYREKIDGQRLRRKLRFRTYQGESRGYLELKKKIGYNVLKRREPMEFSEAIDVMTEAEQTGMVPEHFAPDFHFFAARYRVRPVLHVSYRRQAYHSQLDRNVRVTFDTFLAADWSEGREGSIPVRHSVADQNTVIMEIKFNHAIPVWLQSIAARFALRASRISKYCLGVERLLQETVKMA